MTAKGRRRITVHPRREPLGVPENTTLFAASTSLEHGTGSSPTAEGRTNSIDASPFLATAAHVSAPANSTPPKQDSGTFTGSLFSNAGPDMQLSRVSGNWLSSATPALFDYIPVLIESGSGKQEVSADLSTHQRCNVLHEGGIFNVADTAGSSTPSIAPSTTCSSPQRSTAMTVHKKRRGGDEDHNSLGDDNECRRVFKRPMNRSTLLAAETSVKFACPYQKRNPAKCSVQDSKSCALSHWPSISRLKEHLYRCHKAPVRCPRCKDKFKTTERLDTHLKNFMVCQVRPVDTSEESSEGITPRVELALRRRKKAYPDQTEEERWREVYRILFPNDEHLPNPYFEPVKEDSAHILADYEEYSRREMPKLFESLLEKHFSTMEPSNKTDLVSAVEFCNERILAEYRSKNTTPLPPPSPALALTATLKLSTSQETSVKHSTGGLTSPYDYTFHSSNDFESLLGGNPCLLEDIADLRNSPFY